MLVLSVGGVVSEKDKLKRRAAALVLLVSPEHVDSTADLDSNNVAMYEVWTEL